MAFIARQGQPPRVTSGRPAHRAAEAFVPATAVVGVLVARGLNLLGDRRASGIHSPVRWASSANPQDDELHPECEEIEPHAGHTPWCEKPRPAIHARVVVHGRFGERIPRRMQF
jgi:hypothetical protein